MINDKTNCYTYIKNTTHRVVGGMQSCWIWYKATQASVQVTVTATPPLLQLQNFLTYEIFAVDIYLP